MTRRARVRADRLRHDQPRGPPNPARKKPSCARCQRLRAAGAEVDLWEPASEDVAGLPLTPAGGIGFEGRPQLAARLGQRWLAAVQRAHRRRARQPEQFRPGRGRPPDRPRRVRHEGRDRRDGDRRRDPRRDRGAPRRRDRVHDHRRGVHRRRRARLRAARRRGRLRDVPEPSGLEVWPACRGSADCEIVVPGRAGHTEHAPSDRREGGAVNAIEMARHLLGGVERLRSRWRGMHHPLLPNPQTVVSRLVADSMV